MSMITLKIDGRAARVPAGATILDAARSLGIEIPTLCHRQGCRPSTSCLVCVVRSAGRFVPACATKVTEGMTIESEIPEVHAARKTALELLLSEHVGDCRAPCQFGCPAQMDIPRMLRQIARRDLRGAIETIKRDIPLPAVLGRICPAPCEAVCRRRPLDSAVSICQLKRYVADADLACCEPYRPACAEPTDRRVAILGAGPSALSAGYYLAQKGHAVTLHSTGKPLGGRLRQVSALPAEILDAEIEQILALGVEVQHGPRPQLDALEATCDAIVIACGPIDAEEARSWRLETSSRGIAVDAATSATSRSGVFAIGTAVRGKCLVVRSTADGKEVAESVDQSLSGRTVCGPARPFSSRIGKLEATELQQFTQTASPTERAEPAWAEGNEYAAEEADAQAARCLHCDCRAPEKCLLKRHAEAYRAAPKRFTGQRSPVVLHVQHDRVIYEPGKCIKCGLCIEITAAEQEVLGLTFIGRGFDVRVGVPFDRPMSEALGRLAAACVEACPTAALAFREESLEPETAS